MIKCCKTLTLESHKRLAGSTALFWDSDTIFTVSFIGGTQVQRSFVLKTITQIEELTDLRFKEVSANGVIRISFNSWDGAWSYMGKEILDIPLHEATMNLGWLDNGVVLHEFFHTLGFIHEHQNPEKPIQWNKPAVISALSGPPNNWSIETIEHNIFNKYEKSELTLTPVDSLSIMMYPIPKEWTLDGFYSGNNMYLSKVDIQLLKTIYPKANQPEEKTCKELKLTKDELNRLNEGTLVRLGKQFGLDSDINKTKKENLEILFKFLNF